MLPEATWLTIEGGEKTLMSDQPDVDLDLVREWARQAGQIALRYFNRVDATCKHDRSLVTTADYEIEDLRNGHLSAAYPDHGIVGEEGTRDVHGDCVWAIDPLDGTRAFVAGLPIWGTSIGLLWRGEPWLGLFHMPLLGDWYHAASPTSGAFWNDRPILCPPRDRWDEHGLLCTPGDAHLHYDIRFSGTCRALGSAVAHLCFVARGTALAALVDNAGIWDIAAGAAIVQAAGGALRYLEGAKVEMEEIIQAGISPRPILAAHPRLMDRLASTIEPRTPS